MSPPGGTRSIGRSRVGESDVAAATEVAGTSSGSNSLILPRYSSSLADRVRQISRRACISRYSQAIYRLHNLGPARWQPFGRFGGIEIILAADNLAAGLLLQFAPEVSTNKGGGNLPHPFDYLCLSHSAIPSWRDHTTPNRSSWWEFSGLLHSFRLHHGLVFCGRLERHNFHLRQIRHGRFDQWAHFTPIQPAVATTQWRQRQRTDAFLADHAHQVAQASLDPFDAGRIPPMLLGGKVDDPARPIQLTRRRDKHPADANLPGLARRRVTPVVLRVTLLEHQGDATAHHADSVDRVHNGLDLGVEQVALSVPNHRRRHRS